MFALRLLVVTCLVAINQAAPVCDDNVSFLVAVTASNVAFPATFGLSSLLSLNGSALNAYVKSLPTTSVTGTYNITGRYCEPEVQVASRHNTVQLLVHGAGYTRDYWSGMGLPGSDQQFNGTNYSWADYASRLGYPTFSVDRICNGESSHPNGLAVCQLPMNSAVLHQIIQNLRSGVVGGRSFSKLIWASHSLGSLIGNLHAQVYPSDVDSYILSGYSDRLINGAPGTLAIYQPQPAFLANPEAFGGLLDPTYLASASRSGFEQVFYYGDYNKDVPSADFAKRGTLTLGEAATLLYGQISAPHYTGSLYVLTGQQDYVFCSPSIVTPVIGGHGDCGQGSDSFSAQVQQQYPGVKSFGWGQPQNTGHDLNFHYTALDSFGMAHDFLAANGF